MAEIEINSFFSNAGVPATDIATVTPGFPTIRIWEIDSTTKTLIVGSPGGSGQSTDGLMIEVDDGGSPITRDGFYTFLFTDTIGYDPTKKYLIRSDGGTSLPIADQYQIGEIDPIEETIIDGVWDEILAPDHQLVGSSGLILSQIKADTTQLFLNLNSINDLINLLLKYDTNRTVIDPVANTLTVYDDDCTTALRVFELLDQNGNPSSDSVCERLPISASDGEPVCSSGSP